MKCNVGKTEQIIRIVLGIVSSIRYCPVSDVLGISTCDANNKQ